MRRTPSKVLVDRPTHHEGYGALALPSEEVLDEKQHPMLHVVHTRTIVDFGSSMVTAGEAHVFAKD